MTKTTRRGALAAFATLSIPGCLSVATGSDSFDRKALLAVYADPPPSVDPPNTVRIDTDHLGESERRADALLASVPDPVTDEDISAEKRRAIERNRERAADAKSDAMAAPVAKGRLDGLRRTRALAAYAEGYWAAVSADRHPTEVEADSLTVSESVESYRAGLEYDAVSDDGLELHVYETVEYLLTVATRDLEAVDTYNAAADREIEVAQLSRHVERARAAAADAESITTHNRTRLEAGVESAIPETAATLTDMLDSLEAEMSEPTSSNGSPDEPSEPAVDQAVGWYDTVQSFLVGPFDSTVGTPSPDDAPAAAIIDAHSRLAWADGVLTTIDRAEAGDIPDLDGPEALRTLRRDAVDAVEQRVGTDAHMLDRYAAASVAALIEAVDDSLRAALLDEETTAERLAQTADGYRYAGAIAAAIPDRTAEVVDTFESERS